MTTITTTEPPSLIRLHYLFYVAAALAVMIAAIVAKNLWFLNWVHVFAGLMWTGIDLFMGFILGPILRKVDLPVRREIIAAARSAHAVPDADACRSSPAPRGWYLAQARGFTELPWPQYGWVAGRAGAGRRDDGPGPGLPAADESARLPRIAEARAGLRQDRPA